MSFGAFGNALSVVVFYRAKHRNDATVHYLGALAVSDTCCIIFVGLVLWMSTGLETVTDGRVNLNLFLTSTLSCKMSNYAFVTFQSTSAWIIAIFSLERSVVVWFPLKRRSITSTKRKVFIVLVCLTLCIICMYTALLSQLIEYQGISHCFYDSGLSILGFVILQNSLFYFVPGSIIFTANLLIVIGIVVSRRSRATKLGTTEKDSQDRKSLINLLIVSVMYLVFMTPSTVTWTYYATMVNQIIDPGHAQVLDQLGHLCNQWTILNYCFNFIVYSISLPFYKAELNILLNFKELCRKGKGN
jgi:hypothetical protein